LRDHRRLGHADRHRIRSRCHRGDPAGEGSEDGGMNWISSNIDRIVSLTKILDPLNIVVALTLYTLALLVRVVTDGLDSVPHDTVAAAEAMGYRGWQR